MEFYSQTAQSVRELRAHGVQTFQGPEKVLIKQITQVVAEREFTPRNLQASLLVLILSSCFLLETGGMKTMTNIRSEAKCALLEVAFIIPINVSYSRDREGKKLSPLSRLTPC